LRGDTAEIRGRDKAHVTGIFDFLSDGYFFESGLVPGASFERTFTRAGDHYYICRIHRSMTGKITVMESMLLDRGQPLFRDY